MVYYITDLWDISQERHGLKKKHQWWKGPQQKLDVDTLKIHGVNTWQCQQQFEFTLKESGDAKFIPPPPLARQMVMSLQVIGDGQDDKNRHRSKPWWLLLTSIAITSYTLPETKIFRTWKMLVGRWSFPFGIQPIFKGKLAVGFREGNVYLQDPWDWHIYA